MKVNNRQLLLISLDLPDFEGRLHYKKVSMFWSNDNKGIYLFYCMFVIFQCVVINNQIKYEFEIYLQRIRYYTQINLLIS